MTLSTSDDWFAEPVVPESRHDAYTRRLKAWGYLNKRGNCAWEVTPAGMFASLLEEYYLPQLQRDLNQSMSRMFYGIGPWWTDPERMEP